MISGSRYRSLNPESRLNEIPRSSAASWNHGLRASTAERVGVSGAPFSGLPSHPGSKSVRNRTPMRGRNLRMGLFSSTCRGRQLVRPMPANRLQQGIDRIRIGLQRLCPQQRFLSFRQNPHAAARHRPSQMCRVESIAAAYLKLSIYGGTGAADSCCGCNRPSC